MADFVSWYASSIERVHASPQNIYSKKAGGREEGGWYTRKKTRKLVNCRYLESEGKLSLPFKTLNLIEAPWCVNPFSKGERPKANSYSVHPRDFGGLRLDEVGKRWGGEGTHMSVRSSIWKLTGVSKNSGGLKRMLTHFSASSSITRASFLVPVVIRIVDTFDSILN